MRFPGGCWVEGNVLEDSYHWKTTIGDLAARRTERNLWGYYSPNGLGFHEYLQMCDDLGAEPLFVINCGMSHHEIVPLDKMGPWVQDALDAIQYANGPVTSRWGSLRAKAGHPQPFHLKYMEIGNENGGPAYEERYALFYDAMKAKHPEIHLVANCTVRSRSMEIVDEHYYSSPQFFQQAPPATTATTATATRSTWASTRSRQNAGKGNLRAALGEAAFMTGMERNSDVVLMASYAPLFVNVNNRAWNPDLIDYDSSRVYGTPSYYVQKLFSANRGDVVLPSELDLAVKPPAEPVRGGIGLGTWSTQAEFKDIKVTRCGKVLFQSDFRRGLAAGTRIAVIGPSRTAPRQTGGDTDCRLLAGDGSWSDYTYSLKARKLGGAEGFLVMFHVRDQGNWAWWNLGGWGNVEPCPGNLPPRRKDASPGGVPGRIETGRWYDIRIELQGGRIRCYLDGKLIQEAVQTSTTAAPVYAVASRVTASGEVLLKLVNVSASPVAAQIDLRGVGQLRPTATALVLSGNPAGENSLDEPAKVVPVSRTVEHVAPAFPLHAAGRIRGDPAIEAGFAGIIREFRRLYRRNGQARKPPTPHDPGKEGWWFFRADAPPAPATGRVLSLLAAWVYAGFMLFTPRISTRQLANLCGRLSTSLEAGIDPPGLEQRPKGPGAARRGAASSRSAWPSTGATPWRKPWTRPATTSPALSGAGPGRRTDRTPGRGLRPPGRPLPEPAPTAAALPLLDHLAAVSARGGRGGRRLADLDPRADRRVAGQHHEHPWRGPGRLSRAGHLLPRGCPCRPERGGADLRRQPRAGLDPAHPTPRHAGAAARQGPGDPGHRPAGLGAAPHAGRRNGSAAVAEARTGEHGNARYMDVVPLVNKVIARGDTMKRHSAHGVLPEVPRYGQRGRAERPAGRVAGRAVRAVAASGPTPPCAS